MIYIQNTLDKNKWGGQDEQGMLGKGEGMLGEEGGGKRGGGRQKGGGR